MFLLLFDLCKGEQFAVIEFLSVLSFAVIRTIFYFTHSQYCFALSGFFPQWSFLSPLLSIVVLYSQSCFSPLLLSVVRHIVALSSYVFAFGRFLASLVLLLSVVLIFSQSYFFLSHLNKFQPSVHYFHFFCPGMRFKCKTMQ